MNNSKATKTIVLSKSQKPFLERNEVLQLYYNDIRKHKVLSQEETIKLFNQFHNGSSEEKEIAKTTLFEHNAKLVTSVARQYCSSKNTFMDLIEEGNIGLLNAIEKFDITKQASFQKYALYHIRREINLFKINQANIVQQTNRSKTDNNIANIKSKFIQEQGRNPSLDEILEIYNEQFKDKKNRDIKTKNDLIDIEYIYIDNIGPTDNEMVDGESFYEYNSKSCTSNDFLKEMEHQSKRTMIDDLMNCLSPKEKRIIKSIYGLDGNLEESMSTIAEEMNYTTERIRQLYKGALKKMQEASAKLVYAY